MTVVQDEVSIHTMPKKYGSQSRLIKDLVTQFESSQQDRIYNNQKNLVEKTNHHHISWLACAHLHIQIGHQSYTEWELQSACISRVIKKTIHPFFPQEYWFLKSSLTRSLRNIYPIIQNSTLSHLKHRVEVGGISPGKVREIVKLTVRMNKLGWRTYLNEDKESLVIVSP